MSVPQIVVTICFFLLMAAGAFVLVYSIIRLTNKNMPSELSVGGLKISLKGPAWLVCALIGTLMLSSPVIAAILAKPTNVTIPPPPSSVTAVQSVPEPNYDSFRFVRDVSLLDLRATSSTPWYSFIPGSRLFEKKPRIRPGVLKNYMVVRKVRAADKIHLTYGTSGRLDVRCLTHRAAYERAEKSKNGKTSETWDVIADISAVPVGSEFEIAVEATYWNGFSGKEGDDYTTYGHEQVDPESISVGLLFPDDKAFKGMTVTEYAPNVDVGQPFQGAATSQVGSGNLTFYWTTVSTRPNYYFKFGWTW